MEIIIIIEIRNKKRYLKNRIRKGKMSNCKQNCKKLKMIGMLLRIPVKRIKRRRSEIGDQIKNIN